MTLEQAKERETVQVWIVIEEDRGAGPMVSGVYSTAEAASSACRSNETVEGPHDVADRAEDQIKHMVDRFLSWKLPEHFRPDGGISFKATFNDHLDPPSEHEPTGTNLLSADQAGAMVRYMLEGLPKSSEG